MKIRLLPDLVGLAISFASSTFAQQTIEVAIKPDRFEEFKTYPIHVFAHRPRN
jgi:hypothetical protein